VAKITLFSYTFRYPGAIMLWKLPRVWLSFGFNLLRATQAGFLYKTPKVFNCKLLCIGIYPIIWLLHSNAILFCLPFTVIAIVQSSVLRISQFSNRYLGNVHIKIERLESWLYLKQRISLWFSIWLHRRLHDILLWFCEIQSIDQFANYNNRIRSSRIANPLWDNWSSSALQT